MRAHRPHHHAHPAKAVKKAAAALSVGIGHFSDPWELQGLSHYLEHMLFMGSEKFPDGECPRRGGRAGGAGRRVAGAQLPVSCQPAQLPFPVAENDYDAYLTSQGGASNACTEEVSRQAAAAAAGGASATRWPRLRAGVHHLPL